MRIIYRLPLLLLIMVSIVLGLVLLKAVGASLMLRHGYLAVGKAVWLKMMGITVVVREGSSAKRGRNFNGQPPQLRRRAVFQVGYAPDLLEQGRGKKLALNRLGSQSARRRLCRPQQQGIAHRLPRRVVPTGCSAE